MKIKELLLLGIISPLLTSCITTNNFSILKAEFYQKGLLSIDSIDTIAVFNRDYNYNNYDTFYYKIAGKDKMVMDTLMKYKDLSNTCTDALSDFLRLSGYFKAVVNYRDSMNNPAFSAIIGQRQKTQNSIPYDACIFLDYIAFQDILMNNSLYFNRAAIFNYPEFENSTMMETVGTWLRWHIVLKNDTVPKAYRRIDDLFYGNSVDHELFGSDENHRKLLKNSAGSLGESFANELIPHLQLDNRVYYHSSNAQMLKAKKKLLSEDYRGAAEIYRSLTDHKNENISAKACFNMAMICEIEGSLEASLDWLTCSALKAKKYDYQHFSRCEEYITQIKIRQKEIETLNEQFIKNTAILKSN